MDEILMYAVVISALTIAIVQLIKKTSRVPGELMPLISLGIGIAVGALALLVPEIATDLSVGGHLLAGAISGLSASGAYDLGKKTKQSVDNASH